MFPTSGKPLAIAIPIDSPKYGLHFAMVDADDYELVKNYRWYLIKPNRYLYAQAHTADGKCIFMHKLITGYPESDHADLNGLNNQRDNLRRMNHSLNGANAAKTTKRKTSSQYKGVTWNKRLGKWQAQLMFHRKHISLGWYRNEHNAAMAYNAGAVKYFGKYAHLNDIDDAA